MCNLRRPLPSFFLGKGGSERGRGIRWIVTSRPPLLAQVKLMMKGYEIASTAVTARHYILWAVTKKHQPVKSPTLRRWNESKKWVKYVFNGNLKSWFREVLKILYRMSETVAYSLSSKRYTLYKVTIVYSCTHKFLLKQNAGQLQCHSKPSLARETLRDRLITQNSKF